MPALASIGVYAWARVLYIRLPHACTSQFSYDPRVPYPNADYTADVLPADADAIAPRTRWQEWFSWAFIQAIGSASGFSAEVKLVDSNQTDILIQTWRPLDGMVRTIGLQLKSKQHPEFVDGDTYVVHDLEGERFNRLLEAGNVPRFFVIVAVPPEPVPLMQLSADHAVLEAAAWWVRVTGEPTTQQFRRIKVPTSQRFDSAGLLAMLSQA
jgi:hypothetical protein